jgi:osmotically-inducible protein OsmY
MPDDDRWRNDPERYRYRDDDRWGEGAWGYPRGRRGEYRGGGFGAAGRESWYAAGNGDYRPETDRNYGGGSGAERYAEAHRGRGYREDYRGDFLGSERDYGTSAGYGTGGSALDWREVEGGGRRDWERRRREPGFTDLAFGHGFGTGYEGRDWSGPRRERRGNWDYGRERHERGFLERAGDEIASWFGDDEAARRRREDQRGDYRGRGPKGYRRSDERIRDDVNDRLTDDPHIDASDIEVTVSNREVTLSGTIATRFEKRHAEDIADSVSGVTHVQNNLRVQQEASSGAETGLLAGGGRRIGANESSTAGTAGGAGTARRRSTTSA